MRISAALLVLSTTLLLAVTAHATAVDMTTWQADTGGGAGRPLCAATEPGEQTWSTQSLATRAIVSDNIGCASFFAPQATAIGSQALNSSIQLQLYVSTSPSSDSDRIGFALSYDLGESALGTADYLVAVWIGNDAQQCPSGPSPCEGLSLVHVTGIPTWNDFQSFSGGVTELARATTLGGIPRNHQQHYEFDLTFTADRLTISVDDVLEFDLDAATALGGGAFAPGGFALFNASQAGAEYQNFFITPIPEPSTALLMCMGLVALTVSRRRSRARAA